MPKQVNRVITVTLVMDSAWGELRPSQFVWKGARFRVQRALDCWVEQNRWWEAEAEATIWRLQTIDGGVYEVAKVHTDPPVWKLLAIHD